MTASGQRVDDGDENELTKKSILVNQHCPRSPTTLLPFISSTYFRVKLILEYVIEAATKYFFMFVFFCVG